MTASHDHDRLTIVCLLTPKPEQAATLGDALLALVTPTRADAGCMDYDLYEEANGSLVLFEQWRTRAELETHQQQQPAVRSLFGDCPTCSTVRWACTTAEPWSRRPNENK